jgi:hypothetical protein
LNIKIWAIANAVPDMSCDVKILRETQGSTENVTIAVWLFVGEQQVNHKLVWFKLKRKLLQTST